MIVNSIYVYWEWIFKARNDIIDHDWELEVILKAPSGLVMNGFY